jgi:hypothetical protein
VTGKLTISSASADLSCLCAVDGDVAITAAAGDVSMPLLASVGGSFVATGAGVSSISAPDLASIGGEVAVDGLPALVTLDLTSVTSVGGSFSVSNNPQLTNALLDRVSTVAGDFTLLANPKLAVWRGQQAPRSISGDILVVGNNALPLLDAFGRLATVAGDVTISENAGLASITGFETATAAHGTFTISDNAALTLLVPLPDVLAIDEGLVITGNPKLTDIEGPLFVTSIGAGIPGAPGLVIDGNPSLKTMDDFPALTAVSAVDISFDGALSRLDFLYALQTVDAGITFDSDSAAVGLFGFFALDQVGGEIAIKRSPKITNVSAFTALTVVPSLYLSNVNAVNALPGLGALTTVNGDLTLATTSLTDVDDLAGLRQVHGDLVVAGNSVLTDLSGLSGIEVIDGTLSIQSNPALPQANIDALVAAIGVGNIGAVAVSDNGP